MTVPYNTHIDRKCYPEDVTYDSGTNRTTFTFPYPITGTPIAVTYGTDRPGRELTIISQPSDTTIVVQGNHVEADVVLGQMYSQVLTLSEPMVRQQNQQGQQSTYRGRVQAMSVSVQCRDTGYFRIEATPENRDTVVKEFSGTLHTLETTLGVPFLSGEDSLRAPVLSKSDQVVVQVINDTHMPSAFIGLEWVLFTAPKLRNI